ncbi:MAG: DNA-protecting protein DprA [Acidobacteria bacterium]|nr:DNA-protecting protein DprA [Acidobacteriota bacterium]
MQPVTRAGDVSGLKERKVDSRSYTPQTSIVTTTLGELLKDIRTIPENQQERLGISGASGNGAKLWLAGDLTLLRLPCVAVVGARKVSREGALRAKRLARELGQAGIVLVSGLAKGVDTAALMAAIEAGGKTIAVIGTPIDKAYPAENKRLQEKIYSEHLLISQFPPGKTVYPSNFPERNKLMAAVSDATVIVEASDTSGSLHQAAECVRLGRWLFIAKSLIDNRSLRWPKDFVGYPNTKILTHASEIVELIRVN